MAKIEKRGENQRKSLSRTPQRRKPILFDFHSPRFVSYFSPNRRVRPRIDPDIIIQDIDRLFKVPEEEENSEDEKHEEVELENEMEDPRRELNMNEDVEIDEEIEEIDEVESNDLMQEMGVEQEKNFEHNQDNQDQEFVLGNYNDNFEKEQEFMMDPEDSEEMLPSGSQFSNWVDEPEEVISQPKNIDPNCISRFIPNESNCIVSDQGIIVVGLQCTENIIFRGMVSLRVYFGKIRVFGHYIMNSKESFSLYSPTSHSLLKIEPVPYIAQRDLIPPLEEESPELISCLEKLNIEKFDVVLVFKYLNRPFFEGQSINQFRYLFSVRRGKENKQNPLKFSNFEAILKPQPGLNVIKLSNEWISSMNYVTRANEKNKILICGPKNSGKSTYSRILLNTMIEKWGKPVAYLETDIGQSEFTPCGLVSLNLISSMSFGPTFTHLQTPVRSYFVGYTTPKDEYEYYLQCIEELVQYYEEELAPQGLTLIINTQGWVKGLGLELLQRILFIVKPNNILQFNSPSFSKNLDKDWLKPSQFFSDKTDAPDTSFIPKIQVHNVPAITYSGVINPFSAHDHRVLNFLTYFDNITDSNQSSTIALSSQIPYQVPWHSLAIILSDQIDKEQCLYSLNASVVGLLIDLNDSWGHAPTTLTRQDGSIVDSPRIINTRPLIPCVGLGIIRSIDVEKRLFYILSPTPFKLLKNVNLLVRGNLEIPIEAFVEGGFNEGSYMSYLTAEGSGAIAKKIRNNILRKSNVR